MPTTELTTRERQIVELIGTGSSTKEIANALEISAWTVASHRKRICAKLGVHTTAELVAVALADSGGGTSPRGAARCLSLDLGTSQGRVRLTYSGQLRRTPGAATARIGRTLFYF